MLRQIACKTYEVADQLHHELYVLHGMVPDTKPMHEAPGEVVDAIYALKRSEKLVHDTLKSLRNDISLLEKIACAQFVRLATGDSIRGEFATGTPNMKENVRVPRRTIKSEPVPGSTEPEPESLNPDYVALLAWCGVDQEMIEFDAVRPHWPGLNAYYNELSAQAQPLPPSIDPNDTLPSYSVTARERRDSPLSEYIATHFNTSSEEKSDVERGK